MSAVLSDLSGGTRHTGMTTEGTTMKRTTLLVVATTAVVAGFASLSGVGLANSGDDNEAAIVGSALQRASAAALEHTGEGRVTETEVDDEESYYEVEVTREDGSQVDVQLDRDFNVVGSEDDGDEDEGSGSEDS
jgi:uncharacterized membrane protein YkoI